MMSFNTNKYLYTLASTGLSRNKVMTFITRQAAMQYMYKLCNKNDLVIKEIWNDNHDKTYNCDKGVVFYIQRFN